MKKKNSKKIISKIIVIATISMMILPVILSTVMYFI